MEKQFKTLIEASSRILITSHISPDPDAVCSVLLLGSTLALNYPSKEVTVSLEEEPENLSYLSGYEQIKFQPLADAVESYEPELLIITDASSLQRCTRADVKVLKNGLAQQAVKTAAIDHHQPDGADKFDIYLNELSIAVTQDIYTLCFDLLGLKRPEGYGFTAMTGIYSDSGGFVYANSDPEKTFKIVGELLKDGVSLEKVKNQLQQYSDKQMAVIGELASNISHGQDYTFSFISDDFYTKWPKDNSSARSLHVACKIFVDNYIRNIEGYNWGFIVYRDSLLGERGYSVSLRSVAGVKDVSQIAKKLEGGGHIPAAGGKVKADSVDEAVQKVQACL